MATAYKILGQIDSAATTFETLYTVPSTIKPVVIVIVIVSPSLYEAARLERLYVATGVALITL